MFPVSEDNFFCVKKNIFLSHSGHKISAEIDDTEKTDNGVFLLLFLYQLTCGASLLSGGGMRIAFEPCMSGGVCGCAWFDIDGAERRIFRDCVDDIRMGGKPEK